MPGVPDVLSNDTSGIPAAVAAAKDADAVIIALGTDLDWAAEGHDATSIQFTAAQLELAQKVAEAAGDKPVIAVILTATPLDASALLKDDNVGARAVTGGQPRIIDAGS